MAFVCPAPAVDALTGGGASACLARIQGSPPTLAGQAMHQLQQAEQFLRIIEGLNSATQSLEQAWSGQASEAAVQKIMSTISSFIRIVDAIQQGAALLKITGGLIASAQTGYCSVMQSVNPTVASLMSNPWTWTAAQALASGSLGSVNTYVAVIEAAIHIKGAGQIMQQVAILTTIMMEIEQLSQGGGNAASDASAIIGLYRAGKMEYNTLNPSSTPSSTPAASQCLAPAASPSSISQAVASPQGDLSDQFAGDS